MPLKNDDFLLKSGRLLLRFEVSCRRTSLWRWATHTCRSVFIEESSFPTSVEESSFPIEESSFPIEESSFPSDEASFPSDESSFFKLKSLHFLSLTNLHFLLKNGFISGHLERHCRAEQRAGGECF